VLKATLLALFSFAHSFPRHKKRTRSFIRVLVPLFYILMGVAFVRFDKLSASGTSKINNPLLAGVVITVSVFLAAGLAILHRVFFCIVLRAFAWGVTGISPLVHSVKAGTAMGAAIRTTFNFKIQYKGMSFGTVTLMIWRTAAIFLIIIAATDLNTAVV
jgi:hypothetical protein